MSSTKNTSPSGPSGDSTSDATRAVSADLAAIRQSLLKKRDELRRQLQSELNGLETADRHHLADLEEMASDSQDTDSVCEIMDVGTKTLEQIEDALQKLEDGTYGFCESCESEIPIERLEALPFAVLCIACKRQQESGRG